MSFADTSLEYLELSAELNTPEKTGNQLYVIGVQNLTLKINVLLLRHLPVFIMTILGPPDESNHPNCGFTSELTNAFVTVLECFHMAICIYM